MTLLCRRTLGNAKQVTISRISNSHDTRTKSSIQYTKSQPRITVKGHAPNAEQLSSSGAKSDVRSPKVVYCRL